MADYSIKQVGYGSVSVSVTGLSSSYDSYIRIYIRYDTSESTDEVLDEDFYWDESSCRIAVYGLEAGKDYAINVKGYYYDDEGEIHGDEGWIGADFFSTDDCKPSYFYWTSTIEPEAKFNISRTEWNDFADTVYDELMYVGYEHNYSRSELKVSRGSYLTADLWNIFVELFRYGLRMKELSYVDEGDYIYAHYFTDAEDAINRCIETYGADQFWRDKKAEVEFWA